MWTIAFLIPASHDDEAGYIGIDVESGGPRSWCAPSRPHEPHTSPTGHREAAGYGGNCREQKTLLLAGFQAKSPLRLIPRTGLGNRCSIP